MSNSVVSVTKTNFSKEMKKTIIKEPSKLIITILLAFFGVVMLLPFAWMLSASMKYEVDVFKFPVEWIPQKTRIIENYTDVWAGEAPFALYYWNSIKITVISTFLALLIGSLGAYGFSRIKFAGRETLFLALISMMIIPEQVTILPRFMYFKWLGVFNTHTSLVLNYMFSLTSVFFLRQFMMGISNEISDSARIDGAGHLRIYWSIILPLTKPALATLAILKFIWTWNDYQNPLVLINSPKLYTIQLGVKMFADRYGEFYSLIMAAAVSAILPLFIVFFAGQKHIIEGITTGSVKG